jgi:hypothetical protein
MSSKSKVLERLQHVCSHVTLTCESFYAKEVAQMVHDNLTPAGMTAAQLHYCASLVEAVAFRLRRQEDASGAVPGLLRA